MGLRTPAHERHAAVTLLLVRGSGTVESHSASLDPREGWVVRFRRLRAPDMNQQSVGTDLDAVSPSNKITHLNHASSSVSRWGHHRLWHEDPIDQFAE